MSREPGAPVGDPPVRRSPPARPRLAPDPGLVIPDIAALSAYPPGRPWRELARELGVEADDLLLLAANENVLGPSPRAVEAARLALLEAHLYPDGGVSALRAALADHHGVTPEHVVVGNGSNELIELLVRTFVGPHETVVTAWPSFVVYRLATQAQGREVLLAPLRQDRYDLAALAGLITPRTKLVFISNPNNPTGTYLPRRALATFLERVPPTTLVVLDEAYHEYASAEDYPDGIRDFAQYPRLVVLRTFSKAHGLAGLRVGYGVMDPVLASFLDRVRQPYNVSAPAQAAAIAALGDAAHLDASRRLAREGIAQLEAGLRRLGLVTVPTQANFVMARLGREAQPVVQGLRAAGILARDMRGYDMPDALRITVGTASMNARVLSALEAQLTPG